MKLRQSAISDKNRFPSTLLVVARGGYLEILARAKDEVNTESRAPVGLDTAENACQNVHYRL